MDVFLNSTTITITLIIPVFNLLMILFFIGKQPYRILWFWRAFYDVLTWLLNQKQIFIRVVWWAMKWIGGLYICLLIHWTITRWRSRSLILDCLLGPTQEQYLRDNRWLRKWRNDSLRGGRGRYHLAVECAWSILCLRRFLYSTCDV